MAVSEFLSQFGFREDPFQSTNAGDEPLLEEYFVPPPYFDAVLGDTSNPQSSVIMAPRGGGKTAQRVMIEKDSASKTSYVCVAYDTFDMPSGFTVSQATLSYHLLQINRLLVTAILLMLDEQADRRDLLSEQHKRVLKFGIQKYLGSLSSLDFEKAINSIKNFGDRARDAWYKYGVVVAVVINAAMQKFGLGSLNVSKELTASLDESLAYQFRQFLRIITAMGFSSTYILVDRVDELAITTKDAESAELFINSLLTDLPTLETQTVAFKFFLWDKMEPSYVARGARPDRVPLYRLEWDIEELSLMLARRLRAFSAGSVSSVNQLVCQDVDLDLHRLVCYFAHGSPRDMIRLCKAIVAEQTRLGIADTCLTKESVMAGIRTFSSSRCRELYSDVESMRRMGSVTFTISRLASDVFRKQTESVRPRVQQWAASGAVAKIGEVASKGNRPTYLYGIVDMRLAVEVLSGMDVDVILANYVLECPNCGDVCITDQRDIMCPHCNSDSVPTPLGHFWTCAREW